MARWLCNLVNVSNSLCEHYLAPFLKDNNVSRRKRIDIVGFLLNCNSLVVVYTKIVHYISIQRAQNTNLTLDSQLYVFRSCWLSVYKNIRGVSLRLRHIPWLPTPYAAVLFSMSCLHSCLYAVSCPHVV
jgi:hypothetical protein